MNEFLKVKKDSAGKLVRHQAVISLRHFWEWNYYHFFLDVLGKLSLFDQLGIPRSIPIVLGRYALKLPFVKEALSRGELSKRPLIIQDDAYIFAEEIYYCRIKEALHPRMEHVLQQIDAPAPRLENCERLFLNRPPTGTRRIINDKEVEDTAAKYGFRIVDTAAMSLDDQMKLFAGARYLIAAHGAGITNIIYRRAAPLTLLELCPVSAPDCFQKLAIAYGYSWDNISGEISSDSAQHANYHIDITMLENKIKQMLEK